MTLMSHLRSDVVPLLVIVASVAAAWAVWPVGGRDASPPRLPLVQGTSRLDLDEAEAIARARLTQEAADTPAAIRLAEVLLRKARVEVDAAHAIEAERVLKAVLGRDPAEYSALKLLGAVYLSQHRFAEAIAVAERAIAVRRQDAWNYGVLGDAYVELAASVGDLLAQTGDTRGAEAMYQRAEALEREGWKSEAPQPGALARLFAERGRRVEEAVRLAEEAARQRSDIFTMDALAWAYFQAGRLQEAHAASVRARRTGTADRRILCHARAIEEAIASPTPEDRTQCRFEAWMTEFKSE
ncbi:MAG: hypothetical protein HY657_15935 [Acidobacteria bacterium]|nr:hypothetical protein [Acidobacteriota bacterium]